MKIAVYKIEKVVPDNPEEYEDLCDICNFPSLKCGYVDMISTVSHFITKSELKKTPCVYAKYYNKETKSFMEGYLLLNEKRLFAVVC